MAYIKATVFICKSHYTLLLNNYTQTYLDWRCGKFEILFFYANTKCIRFQNDKIFPKTERKNRLIHYFFKDDNK